MALLASALGFYPPFFLRKRRWSIYITSKPQNNGHYGRSAMLLTTTYVCNVCVKVLNYFLKSVHSLIKALCGM